MEESDKVICYDMDCPMVDCGRTIRVIGRIGEQADILCGYCRKYYPVILREK